MGYAIFPKVFTTFTLLGRVRKTSRTWKTWALSAMCVGMVVVSNKDNKKLSLCEDLSDLKEYVHCKLCIPAEQKCCVNLMPTWGSGRFHH